MNGSVDRRACLHPDFIKLMRQQVTYFTTREYPKMSEMPKFEIFLKVTLCAISITAALIGNLMVLYTILIKPIRARYESRLNRQNNNNSNSSFNMARYLASTDGTSRQLLAANDLNNNNNAKCRLQKDDKKNMPQNNLLLAPTKLSNSHSLSSFANSTNKLDARRSFRTPPNAYPVLRSNSRASMRNSYCDPKYFDESVTASSRSSRTVIKSNEKRPINVFLINLCICDLMIVFWCSWVFMVNSVSDGWRMGAFFCKFNTFVQVMSVVAAISTLTLISIERFKGIVCLMEERMRRRTAVILVILVWLFSITVALPTLYYRQQFKRVWRNHVEIWCSDSWPYQIEYFPNSDCISKVIEPLRQIYYTFISLVLFIIPILVLLICNCLIIRKLNNKTLINYLTESADDKIMLDKRRKRANFLLICLILSFAICWTPAKSFIMFEAHRPHGIQVKNIFLSLSLSP